jgi:hypothetical protein
MSDEPDGYQTLVLRLWRARCQGEWQWRASLEGPHRGERQWFASLEQLFAYLRERCDSQAPDGPDTCPAPGPEDCGGRGKGQYPRGALGT